MGLKFWKKFKSSTHDFANVKSKKIEQELEKEQQTMNKTIKLLMLGAGESGKSTIIKQMRIIHANGYTPEDCEKYLPVILSNMMSYMITIIKVETVFAFFRPSTSHPPLENQHELSSFERHHGIECPQ